MQKNHLIISCQPICIEKKEKTPLPQTSKNEIGHTKFKIKIIKQHKRPHSNQFFTFGKSTHKVFYITRLYKDDQRQNISFDSSLVHPPKMCSSSSVFQYSDFSSNSSLIPPQDTASSQINSASTSLIVPKVHHKTIFKIYKILKNTSE